MLKSVYLCGPITGLSYDNTINWRKYVASKLAANIIPISPMRGKDYLSKEINIKDSYEGSIMSTEQAITARDRYDVMNCDMVVANFLGTSNISIGSVIELGWADAWRKPIVLIIEPNNIHQHSMINQICGFKSSSLDDGIEIINKILSQNFARENQ